MKKTSGSVIAAVVWITLMVAFYYWGHKPFNAQQIAAIVKLLLDFLLIAAVTALCGGFGRRLFLWINRKQAYTNHLAGSELESSVLQAAAGMGIFSLVWLLMGISGLYYRWAAWLVLLSGCVLLRRDILAWFTGMKVGMVFWNKGKRLDRVVILFLILITLLQVLWAAAPPVKYDALSYHLQLPRQYIASHRFIFIPDNPYWGHPQTGEMLFSWMLLLQRAQTAALLGTAWGVLTLLGTAATIQRLIQNRYSQTQDNVPEETPGEADGLRAGLIGAAALALGVTFRGLMGWSYVDLLSALMGWGLLAVSLRAIEQKAPRWILWAAVFGALAVSVKWTGGAAVLALIIWLMIERKRITLTWKQVLPAAGIMALLTLPWLLKNFIFTGSPLYPYFFPTTLIPEQRLSASGAGDSSIGAVEGLLFPISSTVLGFDSAEGFGADLGPLLALLALPGLWFLRNQPSGRLIMIGLALTWGFIAVGSRLVNHIQQVRLYFALLPWAAVAAGVGWLALSRLRTRLLRVETLLWAMLILMMVFTGIQELDRMTQAQPLPVVMGKSSPQEFLSDTLGWYFPAVRSLEELPDGSKVLMLWEARGYYAPLNSTADLWIDRWRVDYWKYGDAQHILSSWKEQGYTHLLFYKSGADIVRAEENVLESQGWLELDRLTASLPVAEDFGGIYVLYQLP